MKKISLYVIVDTIFKFALLFILNLIWSLYFIRTVWLAITISAIATIVTIILFSFFSKKKIKKTKPVLEENQHIEDIKNTFIFMERSKLINFFYSLCLQKHSAQKHKDYVRVTNEKDVILYPYFKMSILNCDTLIDIYNSINKKNVKKIVVLCNSYDNAILKCLEMFKCETIVLDYKQTYYKLLKYYEFYPEITVKSKPKIKSTAKQILLLSFDKKRTRSYVISALFMCFASFFVVYKIYYLIVASILLICAIICQINFNFKTPEKDFDLIC